MSAISRGHRREPTRPNKQTQEDLRDTREAAERTAKREAPVDAQLKTLAAEFSKQMLGAFGSRRQVNQAISEVLDHQLKLVQTPQEFLRLRSLCLRGEYKNIDRWLDRRLRELKRYWKYILHVPSHRVAKPEVAQMYEAAAQMKVDTKLSWTQIARRLDPASFKADPAGTAARFKQGGLKEMRRSEYW
jgi:hypothetical protein